VSRIAKVLLDLDRTFTDPFDGIAASIQHATQRMGFAALQKTTLNEPSGRH
jgi:phosphoglycolate phosphatase-like HAD superfamily hydrolase